MLKLSNLLNERRMLEAFVRMLLPHHMIEALLKAQSLEEFEVLFDSLQRKHKQVMTMT